MTSKVWRQYLAGVVCGAAVVTGVVAWGTRPEAIAVPVEQHAEGLSSQFRTVAAEVLPSIVSIETVTRSKPMESARGPLDDEAFPFREFFRNDPRFRDMLENPRRAMTPRRAGSGSGFIIDSSGLVMTNNHVVAGADEVKVRLHDGREFLATDIKTDPRTDVAVLRIEGAGQLPALEMGDSRAMQVGDWVLAFGSPFGLEATVTQGIISGTSRSRGITEREDFLQTDAAINPGNSGGPLVNMRGQVIGINTAIASTSGGYDGVGFAIPTHIARWVGDQLINHGEVKRGYLGTSIAPVDAATARQFDVKVRNGVIVRNVLPNSPAEKAGLEPGDVILKLNGQPVANPPQLQGVVEQLAIGKSYPLEVVRAGKNVKLDVTIEEMPTTITAKGGANQTPGKEPAKFNELGLQLSEMTPALARQLGLSNATGLVVTAIEPNSPADVAGIASGDLVEKVGTQAVANLDEFNTALKELSLKDGIVLHLRNADGKRFVILRDVQ